MNFEVTFYSQLLGDIKKRIRQAQIRASLSANTEMINMYWDIGRIIHKKQKEKGWGAGVIPRLAVDLKNELPEIKGFSERNINRMLAFFREYPAESFLPQPVAKLNESKDILKKMPQPVAQFLEKGNLPNLQQLVAKIP
ncbi:MAG: DUF1016 N-terminal domain-containing protein [Desulfobacteraceae bacterium]|jgi:hypothetical protein